MNNSFMKTMKLFTRQRFYLDLGNNNRKTSVSGIRCSGGSVFDERDKFWYCQTNDRDYEYCCSPHSSCGYSKGFEQPW